MYDLEFPTPLGGFSYEGGGLSGKALRIFHKALSHFFCNFCIAKIGANKFFFVLLSSEKVLTETYI